MTVRLDKGTAEQIVGAHNNASTKINDSATTMPGEVDWGDASPYVQAIVQNLCQTASEIAVVNLGAAMLVAEAADEIGLTDAEVRDAMDHARRRLK